jgi:hypothetical protein
MHKIFSRILISLSMWLCVGLPNFQNIFAQAQIENSIIFTCNFNSYDKNLVAVPIVIYKNGKYVDPPYYAYDREPTPEEIKMINNFKKELAQIDYLHLLNNGMKYQTIKVGKLAEPEGGISEHPSLQLMSIPAHRLLSNNPKLGTNVLQSLESNDRPLIFNRKVINETLFDFDKSDIVDDIRVIPFSKVDIDGDGIPEIVYYFEAWELSYFQIFSKRHGKWEKVFDQLD